MGVLDVSTIPPQAKAGQGLAGSIVHSTLFDCLNDDGSVVVASGQSAGNFKISNTTGTSVSLVMETANNNTKTDKVIWPTIVPDWYDPTGNSNLTVKVNVGYSNPLGTLGTHTILVAAYGVKGGVYSANLVVTAAQVIQSTTQATYSFLIANPTGLSPGQRIVVQLTMIMQETAAGGNVIGAIYGLTLS